MKLIIDISEADYWKIKEYFADLQVYLEEKAMDNFSSIELRMQNAVYHGKPLPEHHGRLIDADELKKHKYHDSDRFENAVAVYYIDNAPTVIEASESEE